MSAQNLRQRHALMTRLATAPTREQRAAFARDFEKRHPYSGALRFELERADRIAAQLEADALLARIRAAGEVGCAEPVDSALTFREGVRIFSLGLLAIAGMVGFGYVAAPYVAPTIAWLRGWLA